MAWELILFLACAAAVSVGCLVPARWLPALPNDKLLHFLAFGALTLLAGRLATNSEEFAVWSISLFIAGYVIESLQQLVPGRSFCWRDMAANTAGILTAVLFSPILLTF